LNKIYAGGIFFQEDSPRTPFQELPKMEIRMKPKMILFDAGKTLIDYRTKVGSDMAYLSTREATERLMPYIISNPHGYDADTIDRWNNQIFAEYEPCRKALYEIPNPTILKTMFERLSIRLSISMIEVERIIWEYSGEIVPIEGVAEMLATLRRMGIRTTVISNLDLSGYLLEERLRELFSEHVFEFVIASSDYGVRKPHKLLFEAGISKSGLAPSEIWYVGDKYNVDVLGSAAVGIKPVWFRGESDSAKDSQESVLVIRDYSALSEEIERM
jgi:putative hydrolase of the HAD superfamily